MTLPGDGTIRAMTTTLVLLRHAKSAYPPGVDDHDRPLNARGRRDAPVAGRLIAEAVGDIDVTLVSTATRAQETFELARPALLVDRVDNAPGLYLAPAQRMLAQIRDLQATTALVVAHNPGTEDLAARLCREQSSDAYTRMTTKFPTAAFAVLIADVPFSEWDFGSARLERFEIGRAG